MAVAHKLATTIESDLARVGWHENSKQGPVFAIGVRVCDSKWMPSNRSTTLRSRSHSLGPVVVIAWFFVFRIGVGGMVFIYLYIFCLTFLNNQLYELNQMNWTKKKLSTTLGAYNPNRRNEQQKPTTRYDCVQSYSCSNSSVCARDMYALLLLIQFFFLNFSSLISRVCLVKGASQTKAFRQFAAEQQQQQQHTLLTRTLA